MAGLTILGASARAAAYSAARAGYTPYAIDSFADQDLGGLCTAIHIERYPAGFYRELSAAPQAPWIYTGGLENHPRLIDRLAKLRPLWGNAGEVLSRVRDPWQLAAILDAAGLDCPRLSRSATTGDWLLKPLRGSAGLGVRRPTAAQLKSPPRGTILQQYVDGECGSAVYVAAQGRGVLLGATRQLIGRDFGLSAEFIYAGSIGPLPLSTAQQATLRSLGDLLAREFRLIGLFGVDFIRTNGNVWPLEVNPRYAASIEILERTGGQAYIAHHAAACRHGELPESVALDEPHEFTGKAIVYARQHSRVSSNMPWPNTQPQKEPQTTASGVTFARPVFADLPAAGHTIHRGHPVATVFAEGPSPHDVEAQLRQRAEQVQDALLPL